MKHLLTSLGEILIDFFADLAGRANGRLHHARGRRAL